MAVLESSMEEGKSPKYSPKNSKKILLLAQDLSYARNLAANEEKVRRRSLKYLKRYLEQRSQASRFTEENLKILWKGLFYAMWMSDKPLVQEECAENIAHLIHCPQFDEAMQFFKIGLLTLQNEWIGIDQLRLDKFLMFVRRLLRQALIVLKKVNFRKNSNEVFAKILEDTILNLVQQPPLGLFMHFTEIYLEEIAKVADGKLQPSRTLDLIKPYILRLAFATDNRVVQWIVKFIFTHLMKQHKLGLEYEDKYKIWKMQGFEGSINQIQKIIVSDDEWGDDSDSGAPKRSLNKSLDPRAGRVDVELPQILFNAKEIAEALMEPKSDPKTSKNTRNHLNIWSERYLKLHNGIYPLGIKKLVSEKRTNLDNYDTNVRKAAKKLLKFEEQLLSQGGKFKKKRGKSESQAKELSDTVTKTNNLEMELERPNNVKKHKKGTYEPTKNNSKIELSSLESKQTQKQKKKLKALESKRADMKNTLKNKLREKKLKQKATKYRISDDDYNYCFKRNSGVWYVSPEMLDNTGTLKSSSEKETEVQKNNEKNDIFIPSKKIVKRMKKTKSDEEFLVKLRGKSRTSINNLSTKKVQKEVTPWKQQLKLSPKKVVINTKLNVSQEIDDHILQVISSPQLPWDSRKKPGKPLLKTPIKSSPINPFYRLKTL